MLFLQELSEHSGGIDLDKRSGAGGQDFPFRISDLGGAKMLSAVDTDLPAFGDQQLGERHGPDVVDLHGCGDGNDVAQLADLTHGFVEDGGDDASMGVRWWPFKAVRQREVADKTMPCLVEVKLQPQAAVVVGPASEARVAINVLLDLMSGNWFVLVHATKMNQAAALAQVRTGLAAIGFSGYQLCDRLIL
jgi:hypothetical protein